MEGTVTQSPQFLVLSCHYGVAHLHGSFPLGLLVILTTTGLPHWQGTGGFAIWGAETIL